MSKNYAENGEKKVILRRGEEISSKELERFAEVFAVSFKDYPLFEYFSNYKYSVAKMKVFWRVALRIAGKSSYFVTSDEEARSLAFLFFAGKKYSSIWQYIKAGGLAIVFKMGLPTTLRMLRFDDFALEIKNRYADENCLYFYAFATLPEHRGAGLGSGVLKKIIEFLDSQGKSCYLETMSIKNVAIYEKYGFEVKETVKIPNSDITLYAMLRAAR